MYIQSLYFIITVPTDGLAPHGARPSAGTVSGSDYKKTHVLCQISVAIIDFWVTTLDQIISSKVANKILWNLVALRLLNSAELSAKFGLGAYFGN